MSTLKYVAFSIIKGKGKGSFYIAQYPVRWTAKSALHFSTPGRPVHPDTNSASPGSIDCVDARSVDKYQHYNKALDCNVTQSIISSNGYMIE